MRRNQRPGDHSGVQILHLVLSGVFDRSLFSTDYPFVTAPRAGHAPS
ncbi:hypothetical protein QRX60_03660 [Amycolatopsis mongoliensis]|uniref:Uncharacterized protein n=1 Tax=Amycolatopsis mongoliensis TaxID=715475 RepID=A0A9Y2JSW5_9PSEU|nr:hypothetical protein [Amycolatopsis sp. 4-36]WIY02979.1 hypothetical protein QRX60_03660 [Amycolatopsis sp. 4-36]